MFNFNDDDNPWAQPDDSSKPSSSGSSKPPQSKKPSNSSGKKKPNLDDIVVRFQDRLKDMNRGGQSPGGGFTPPPVAPKSIFIVAALAFMGLWLFEGFFRVQEGELAIVLRFGKMNRTVMPGLRYRLPYPFEDHIVKKVEVLNKIDSVTKEGPNRNQGDNGEQTLILSGDENMVHTNYTVLWKIRDIQDYVFSAREPESTIRVAAESAIREVIGQTTARSALTEGRDKIGTQAQELLQKILDNYKLGIQIVSVQLQRVEPPLQVIKAFNDMQASLVDADRMRNEAEAYQNDKVPRARGDAQKIIQDSEAYQQETILLAQGDAARFKSILDAAGQNKEIARILMYSKIVPQLLAKSPKTVVDGKVGSGVMPYYNLGSSGVKASTKGTNHD
jgi:membrane protease subunit HflK